MKVYRFWRFMFLYKDLGNWRIVFITEKAPFVYDNWKFQILYAQIEQLYNEQNGDDE